MTQKVHSLEKLRTNSHNEQSNEGVDMQKEEEENQIIVSKQCEGIKGVLKNKKKGQAEKLKVLRFSLPIKQIYIVENWKRYNQNFDEEKESCCQQF